jgi:hypothetical protein
MNLLDRKSKHNFTNFTFVFSFLIIRFVLFVYSYHKNFEHKSTSNLVSPVLLNKIPTLYITGPKQAETSQMQCNTSVPVRNMEAV